MDRILFLAHTEPDRTLAKHTREALTGAATLANATSSTLVAGVVGGDTSDAVRQIGSCGASRVLMVEGAGFNESRYATDAAAAEAITRAAGATMVVAPGTSRWARALPGLAVRLGGRVDTHVSRIAAVDGRITVSRWFYRQRMEGVVTRAERPWIVLVDPGAHEPWNGAAADVSVERIEVASPPLRTTVIGVRSASAGEQTIRPDAELLFVTGAGWTKKQADGQVHADRAEQLILAFLRAANASLGSTKSLVDLSGEGQAVLRFLTHLNQVGQTGASPRHKKGLATCCHGEEPHVVGWRFISERRAVNLNPNCGWAQAKADVLYVADAFEVMEKVNALLA
jgi:electron transfer flavoprotein alpha subunit